MAICLWEEIDVIKPIEGHRRRCAVISSHYMKSLLLKLIVVLLLGAHSTAFAESCYETTVKSPSPFMGNNGEIIKLADDSVWEVKYAYEYLYAYYPTVTICPAKGKLLIKDKSIDVQAISSRHSTGNGGQGAIESTIVSKFDGLNTGNIYKLANGQIWEQVEPWIWTWVWVNPVVTIYFVSGEYKMKVEQIEHPVVVRRIKR